MTKILFFLKYSVLFLSLVMLLTTNVEATNIETSEPNIESDVVTNEQVMQQVLPSIAPPAEIHIHKYNTTTFSATCTQDGYTAYVCECGDSYTNTTNESAYGHNWSDWNITKTATLLEDGQKSSTCSICLTKKYDTIPSLSKNDKTIIFKKPQNVVAYMVKPKEEDFGKYYDNAVKLYSAMLEKQTEEIGLFFSNDTYEMELEEYHQFKKTYEEKVLQNNACLIKRSISIGAFPEGAGLTRINIVPNDTLELQQLCYDALTSAGIISGITQVEAVKKINNWIVDNITYETHQDGVVESLKSKKGVCSEYAYIFSYLCKYVGIKTEYVTGCVDGNDGTMCYGCHAWNKVKLCGEWYYIDVCWNDSNPRNRYYLSKKLWNPRTVFDSGDYT